MYMVRKQLYISDEQEQLLKRRAHELGTTEAELMRRALDLLLRDYVPTMPSPQQLAALRRFKLRQI